MIYTIKKHLEKYVSVLYLALATIQWWRRFRRTGSFPLYINVFIRIIEYWSKLLNIANDINYVPPFAPFKYRGTRSWFIRNIFVKLTEGRQLWGFYNISNNLATIIKYALNINCRLKPTLYLSESFLWTLQFFMK